MGTSNETPDSPQSWTYLLEEDIDLDDIDLSAVSPGSARAVKPDWNKLPNEILVLIFKKYKEFSSSMQEMIRLQTVCPRWMILIDQHVFEPHSKRSLKLFSGSPDLVVNYCRMLISLKIEDWQHLKLKPVGQDDDFIVPVRHFTIHFVISLNKLFPDLEQLVFHGIEPKVSDILPKLLSKWPNLTSLTLFIHLSERFIPLLFRTINKLTALKRLDLMITGMEQLAQIDILAPTLRRVEHFSFRIPNAQYMLAYGHLNPSKCKSLSTFGHFSSYYQRESLEDYHRRLIEINPELVANLTELHLASFECDIGAKVTVNIIGKHFLSLRHLSLRFLHYNDTYASFENPEHNFEAELLNALVPLKHLTELKLDQVYVNLDSLKDEEIDMQIPKLTSVKILHLSGFNFMYGELESEEFCRILSIAFPNLEQLFIQTDDSYLVDDIKLHLNKFTKLRHHKLFSLDYCSYENWHYDIEMFGRHQEWFKAFMKQHDGDLHDYWEDCDYY